MAKLGTATVFITGNVKGLNDALGKAQYSAKRTVGNITNTMKSAGQKMTIAGAAMTAVLGTMISKWAEAGDEVQKMALRTGFSTEALSEFRHAAELSGTSIESLEKGVRRMQRAITEAGEEQRKAAENGKEATGTYTDALAMLNLTFADLENLNPEEQFNKIAMALADVEDKTRQSAIAQEIFGRSGADLLPMLEEGSAGLAAMREEARALGIVFDQETADKAAKLNDDILRLKQQFAATAFQVAETLVPIILERLIPALQDVAEKVTAYVEKNPELIMAFAAIAAALSVGGPLLLGLSQLVTLVATLGWSIIPVSAALIGFAALLETFSNPTGFDNFLTRAIDRLDEMKGLLGEIWDIAKNISGIEFIEQLAQFAGAASGGSFKEAMKELADVMKSMPGLGLLPGVNPRAMGGPVSSNTPYLVGERGPELFVPKTAGQIINNRETGRIMGGQTINVVVNARTNADPREIAKSIRREMRLSFA